MIQFKIVAFCAVLALATSQNFEYDDQNVRSAPARLGAPKPTPIAILKQINRHNEDGSYTYGYEGGDGSFKIETKLPTGEVKGKYGYVDDTGKVRVVEYGATKYGFEPSGEGITVAPPTLVDETTNKDGSTKPEYTAEYYDPEPAPRPAPRPKARPSFDSYSPPQQFEPAPQRAPVPQRAQITGASPVNFEYSAPKPRPAPLRPAPSSFSFDDDQFQQQSPRPLPKISYAQPAPARPATKFSFDDDFGSQQPQQNSQFSFDEPRFAPQARPAPQQQQFANAAPAPRQQYAAPAPRPAPAVRSSGGGGILDQLAKDYALPNGGSAPLHDISFGYY